MVTPERDAVPVHIRLGKAPAALSAALSAAPSYEASESEFLLRLPGIATYYAREGMEIIVDPEAGAPDLDVRSYLMGSLFAIICHQRGLLPLHASAIETLQGAAAFLGASGAGKSSMVAFLARRGHRIVADDICVVDPAAPRSAARAARSAVAEALGHNTGGDGRVQPGARQGLCRG